MSKVILIKHAAPEVIAEVPAEHWRLSEKGRASCAPLTEALRPHAPSVIVASEEPKARETAEIIALRLGIRFEAAPNLHEHDRSNVPHMRSGEFISHMEVFFRKRHERVLGRETAREADDRFAAAVDDVLAEHPQGNVAIVAHGTVIALFLCRHGGKKPFELWREMGLPSFAVLSLPDFQITTVTRKIG